MVRRFDPEPLPAEVLERILHSATRAPSAGFSQGLDLVVLEGPEAVQGFWRATSDPRFGKPYSTATPPVIVTLLMRTAQPLNTWKTRSRPAALIVTWPAPRGSGCS